MSEEQSDILVTKSLDEFINYYKHIDTSGEYLEPIEVIPVFRIKQWFDYNNEEIERLNNIINELEKYIGQEYYCFDNESVEFEVAKNILDKLKELKEKSDKE